MYLLNKIEIFKKFIEIFVMNNHFALTLHYQNNKKLFIMWGDEIFGRHALLSRG